MIVNREKYFEVLDFINEVNGKDLWDLDLSEFFEPIPVDKLKELRELYGNINNYNIIYLLSSQTYLRDEHNVKLVNPK